MNKHAKALAKLSHKKSPRSKEFYRDMQVKSIIKRLKNKSNGFKHE